MAGGNGLRRGVLFALAGGAAVSAALTGLGLWAVWPRPPVCESVGARQEAGRCVFAGDLVLRGDIAALPEGLEVRGDLTIEGTAIQRLPAGLSVAGDLTLYKTSIGALPEGLRVGGDFTNYLGFGSPVIRCAEVPASVIIRGDNLGCDP